MRRRLPEMSNTRYGFVTSEANPDIPPGIPLPAYFWIGASHKKIESASLRLCADCDRRCVHLGGLHEHHHDNQRRRAEQQHDWLIDLPGTHPDFPTALPTAWTDTPNADASSDADSSPGGKDRDRAGSAVAVQSGTSPRARLLPLPHFRCVSASRSPVHARGDQS